MKLLRCVCYIRPFVFATGEVLAFAPGQVLVRIRQNAGLCRAQKEGPRGVTARYGNGDGDAERVSGFGRAVEGSNHKTFPENSRLPKSVLRPTTALLMGVGMFIGL